MYFYTHREGFKMSKSTNRFRIGPVRTAFSLGDVRCFSPTTVPVTFTVVVGP